MFKGAAVPRSPACKAASVPPPLTYTTLLAYGFFPTTLEAVSDDEPATCRDARQGSLTGHPQALGPFDHSLCTAPPC
jgi:hypothetical protein